MIYGTSAVDLYGIAAQTETRYEKKTEDSAFRDIYRNTVESMDDIFEEAASAYDISADLLKAVAKAESNFNPSAVSHAGAIGVMQLMPGTASALGVTNPYDARQNIMGGAKYLKTQLDRYDGNVSLALAAYNAGPGSVAKYGGVPPYAETQNYVKKVTSYMSGGSLTAGTYVNSSSAASGISSLGSLYGSSALEGLGSLYGSSALGGFGSLYGSSSLGALGSLFGSSSGSLYGTSDLAGLGGTYGSALTGTGSLYGMSSIYGSSANMLNLLMGSALQSGEEDEDSLDKDSLYNMVELVKLQLMMNVSSQAGSITI